MPKPIQQMPSHYEFWRMDDAIYKDNNFPEKTEEAINDYLKNIVQEKSI